MTAPKTPKKTNTLKRPAVVRDAAHVMLGETYTDSVTGKKGIATIVYIHLTGCDQVALEFVNKDDEIKFLTVDATRLVELQQVENPRPGAGRSGLPSRGPAPSPRVP